MRLEAVVCSWRGMLDSGERCALCSFLSMYFFKSGPVDAGIAGGGR